MAKSELTITTLGELALGRHGLVDGSFGSSLPASDYTAIGVPLIRGNNLTLGEGRFRFGNFVFVSEHTAARHVRSSCKAGDVVFTKKGTIGQTGIVPKNDLYDRYLISGNQMKLTVNPSKADPLFVYYFVTSQQSREKIIQDASVTGVPKINVAYLRQFPIALPPLRDQRAIAHTRHFQWHYNCASWAWSPGFMTVVGLSESVVEEAALAWLESLGFTVKHGPDIAPGELVPKKLLRGMHERT